MILARRSRVTGPSGAPGFPDQGRGRLERRYGSRDLQGRSRPGAASRMHRSSRRSSSIWPTVRSGWPMRPDRPAETGN